MTLWENAKCDWGTTSADEQVDAVPPCKMSSPKGEPGSARFSSNGNAGRFSPFKEEIVQDREERHDEEQAEERNNGGDRNDDDAECRNEAAAYSEEALQQQPQQQKPKKPRTKKKKKKRRHRRDKVTVMRNISESSPVKQSTLSRLLFSNNNKESKNKDQLKVVYRQFGPDAKTILTVEREDGMPSPEAPDHVVVKIQASTVTLEDCKIRRGFDFDVFHPICLPQTPGVDIVGHVCAAGSKAYGFKEGDRVAALVRTGGNARYLSVPSSSLVKISRSLDSAEAVAMVSIYTTAYQTLKRITQKGPTFSLLGKKVLIVGGMDAVGQALIQMCAKARAEIYTTGPDRCHGFIANILGATPLPENHDEWLPMVRGEMDYVFDGICEDGLASSHQALNKVGELVCYSHTAMLKQQEMGIFGAPMSAHVDRLWTNTLPRTRTVDIWESFQSDPGTFKKNLKSLAQLLKWAKIKPHIVKTVTLSEVANMQTKLESGQIRGAVVCLPWNTKDDPITRKN